MKGKRGVVVVVDDDPLFLSTLTMNLEDAGLVVHGYSNGPAALDALSSAPAPDALLLDYRMPGMDGIEVLRRLRAADIDAPAIFLTVLTEPIFEEVALNHGAVDFIEKSRSFSIVLKRLQLILGNAKTPAASQSATVEAGGEVRVGLLMLRPETKRAEWGGREVGLSLGEYEVVMNLAGRPGVDVSYREIYDLVRGSGFMAGDGTEGYRANVRAIVKRIRRKFMEIDPAFDALENYPGFGYRWRQE